MSERDAVLFANEAFYRAFADRDVAAMDELWAKNGPVLCIHPGWQALTSRNDVIASWTRILTSGRSPAIICREPEAFMLGDVALVVCFEDVEGEYLIATNVFRREGGVWKIVHHQAGPTAGTPAEMDDDEEPPAKPN